MRSMEYEEAIKRDPGNAPFRNNLAAAYLKMGLVSTSVSTSVSTKAFLKVISGKLKEIRRRFVLVSQRYYNKEGIPTTFNHYRASQHTQNACEKKLQKREKQHLRMYKVYFVYISHLIRTLYRLKRS